MTDVAAGTDRRLLSIDPGIVATGYAVFDDDTGPSLKDRLLGYGTVRTDTDDEISMRIGGLARELLALLRGEAISRIIVERPAIAGVYGKRANRQHSAQPINGSAIAKLNQASGAILAACAIYGVVPTEVTAPRISKRERDKVVYNIWPHLNGHSNEHVRDAIWHGVGAF